MTPQPGAPLVSVLIPLYRSTPFLPIVRQNIAALPKDGVEIIVSDRHHLDDAIDVLAHELRDDPRVRIVAERDGIGWVAHFHALLAAARGDHTVWMQHDDTFPVGYVPRLLAAAQHHPACWVVFGDILGEDLDAGGRVTHISGGPAVAPANWGARDACRLLFSGRIGLPFRGLMRRDALLRLPFLIRSTPRQFGAEGVWLFALALCAPMLHVPGVHCVKRLHAASFTRSTRLDARGFVALIGCALAYARHYPMRRARAAMLAPAYALWTLMQMLYHLGLRRWLPHAVTQRLRDALARVVTRPAGGR